MKLDPYKHEERYFNWKIKVGNSIPNLSESNSKLILHYLNDMEKGMNIASASAKGSRSYTRLNSLRDKLCFFARKFQEIYNLQDITQIKEEQLIGFFSDMKNGNIKREDGKEYHSVDTYSKIFKAFWHWHQKVNKKNGNEILDITTDLDTKQEKPKWVYLSEEQVKRLCDNAKYEYKVLFMFLFDTGIRSPTELMNIRVSDLYNNFKELNIRDEISKTFGRRIKLMLCSDLLKEYIKSQNLKENDYLFQIKPFTVNKYLKRLTTKLFGDRESEAGTKYSEMSLYDFRHCSCCYWLPRYKSESALKYRFGWKKSDKIHYYSELLGMKDTIVEEDLLIDTTKTEIEQEQIRLRNENNLLKDKINSMESQMQRILELVDKVVGKI
jgi:integrase